MTIMNILCYLNIFLIKIRRRWLFVFSRFYSDKIYLQKMFPLRLGYLLNLDNPQTFNEKLQWMKLYDRNPAYTQMVDKIESKKFVASIIGEEHIIPTIAVYDSVDKIDFDMLPNRFVLKCSHDSGGLIICKDKNVLNKTAALKKLKKALKKDYYLRIREWPYKNVKPRILAEAFIEDKKDGELRDYKFFCFNGKPSKLLLASGRFGGDNTLCLDFFDMNFNHLDLVEYNHPNSEVLPHKPHHFEEMKSLAEKLSTGIPQVRVDFYEANDHIYFGEMTFFDMGGYRQIHPDSWDLEWGKLIDLPKKD